MPANVGAVAFLAPKGLALFVKRGSQGDHAGEWAFPAGGVEEGESFDQAARREALEETGFAPKRLRHITTTLTDDGSQCAIFVSGVEEPFTPRLNAESSDSVWAPIGGPPSPLHPGTAEALRSIAFTEDAATLTKEEAGYRAISSGKERCGAPCAMFQGNRTETGRCSLVDGPIEPEATCDFFEARGSDHRGDAEKPPGEAPRGSQGGSFADRSAIDAEVVSSIEHPAREAAKRGEEAGRKGMTGGKSFRSDHETHAWGSLREGMPKRMTWPSGSGDQVLAFDRALEGIKAPRDGLAFDRATARSFDSEGRLHLAITNISKANICPYIGREIPGCEELGLEPDRIYQLLRDPDELAKGAESFNRLPLLSKHVAVSADDHQPDLVIGATGSDASFDFPYLKNSLVIWAKDAIDAVESEERKELSSAYRYTPDMTPGEYEGMRFDGVMRDIVGNHVALVKEGRAGTDVVVGDSAEELKMSNQTTTLKMKPHAIMLCGAVYAHVKPLLAKDAKVDFNSIYKSIAKDKKPAILEAIKTATKGKLAKDASVEELATILDVLSSHPEAVDADPAPQKTIEGEMKTDDPTTHIEVSGDDDVPNFLKGKLSEDDFKTVMDMMSKGAAKDNDPKLKEFGAAGDQPPGFKDMPKVGGKDAEPEDKDKDKVSKGAMDEAIAKAVRSATATATATQKAIREAERFVRPWVGDLAIACDSADAVYKAALDSLGVDVEGVHASAFPKILGMQPKPGSRSSQSDDVPPAMDSAQSESFNKMFPELGRIGILG